MAINLAEKYSKVIDARFTHESFIQGNVSNDYEWDGVRAINIYTPQSVALNDYNRAASGNRYGTPTEIQDSVQRMELTQDKSFSLTVDAGNNSDQEHVKTGAKMMKMEIAEQVVPYCDAYALGKWVNLAGTRKSEASAPTKSTIVEMIFDAATAMDNGLVPQDNRILYLPATYYNMVRLSSEFVGVDALGEKVLTKGVVGLIADMKCVKVPDKYMADAYFLATYKNAVLAPKKINDAKIHIDPPGINGTLLEGRYYFDAFVRAAKAMGVYACIPAAKAVAAPVVAIASHAATVTAVTGVTFYYTLDGTDPRYSKSAKVYSAAVTTVAGQTIKVAGQNAAGAWSPVTDKTDA